MTFAQQNGIFFAAGNVVDGVLDLGLCLGQLGVVEGSLLARVSYLSSAHLNRFRPRFKSNLWQRIVGIDGLAERIVGTRVCAIVLETSRFFEQPSLVFDRAAQGILPLGRVGANAINCFAQSIDCLNCSRLGFARCYCRCWRV